MLVAITCFFGDLLEFGGVVRFSDALSGNR